MSRFYDTAVVLIISFEQQGGFVGQVGRPLGTVVDTAAVGEEERADWEALVNSSRLVHEELDKRIAPYSPVPVYRILIDDPRRTISVTVAEPDVPDSLRPLIERLQRRIREQMLGSSAQAPAAGDVASDAECTD
jgi:hypothetical protein